MENKETILRHPSGADLKDSQMAQYMGWLSKKGYPSFSNYLDFHQWSVTNIEEFWESIWKWSGIKAHQPYRKVLSERKMPGADWFQGARLNFAENLLSFVASAPPDRIAIISLFENGEQKKVTCKDLLTQVKAFASFLRSQNVKPGDRVVAVVCHTIEPIVAMLATTSLGAIWSSCSPDFGVQSILDRFGQIEPKIFISVDGYQYNGKSFSCLDRIEEILKKVPSIQTVVVIHQEKKSQGVPKGAFSWEGIINKGSLEPLKFESLPFNHPVYILYSSGTTGKPKCIVHGAGGTLLQHIKEHRLHTNITSQDNFFYFTTCGWMMWNWLVSGLMTGAQLILYEGSPVYPRMERLWEEIEKIGITVFGTSAKFIGACRNTGLSPRGKFSLKTLRAILSTGSPLLPEDFDWVYHDVKEDLLLVSISGGTDIVSCFVLGNPMLPVYRGEIQCKGLGMAVCAFSKDGHEVINQQGELVCTQPVPSMPIYFWNDPDGSKYQKAYFDQFEGVWRHGDYVMFNERGGSIIYGRSDATLNPGGVRIGTAEIYRQVETLEEVKDSLAVGQPWKGDERVILFVVLKDGYKLSPTLEKKMKDRIKEGTTPRHVPDRILEVKEIPYTISGKKVELAVAKILRGENVDNRDALANPQALEQFEKLFTLVT